MKKIIMLMSAMVFLVFSGCNESAEPSEAIGSKLVRIDYENRAGIHSTYFEYENGRLAKKETDDAVYRYSYEGGILKVRYLDFLQSNIFTKVVLSLEGDKLIAHHYASVNHFQGNFVDTDGLMLHARTERYWISDDEMREDEYSYYLGNESLRSYTILKVKDGNVYKAESVQMAGGELRQTHEWEFFEEIKDPENFRFFGESGFIYTNFNIKSSYVYQGQTSTLTETEVSYELTEEGYPIVISTEYVDADNGNSFVTTKKYFYK